MPAQVSLPYFKTLLWNSVFLHKKIELVSCGESGNTQTQFAALNGDTRYNQAAHLTLISSDYHVPRIERTASKNLTETTQLIEVYLMIDIEGLP